MSEFEFVEEFSTRDIWRRKKPLLNWLDVFGEKMEIQTWLGAKIADNGIAEIVMKAFVPTMNAKPLELRSGAYAGQSDIFAVWRGMHLLEGLETSPDNCLGSDLVEFALALCTRVSRGSQESRISQLSSALMTGIDGSIRDMLMTQTPSDLVNVVQYLVEHRAAKFSPDPFCAEFEAGLLPEEDLSVCLSLSEMSGPISESFTPYLFSPEVLAGLDAQRLAGKKP